LKKVVLAVEHGHLCGVRIPSVGRYPD